MEEKQLSICHAVHRTITKKDKRGGGWLPSTTTEMISFLVANRGYPAQGRPAIFEDERRPSQG